MPPKASSKKRPLSATSNELHQAKRPATAAPTAISSVDVDAALIALPHQVLRDIVRMQLDLDPGSPLAEAINIQYRAILSSRSNEIIDFDHHSKDVWRELNVTHSCKTPRRQADVSGEVERDLSDRIRTIVQQATAVYASKGTKRNALVTLQKIGKTISLTYDQLGEDVCNGECPNELCEAMKKILQSMSLAERREAFEADDLELLKKTIVLIEVADAYGIMDGLGGVLGLAGIKFP